MQNSLPYTQAPQPLPSRSPIPEDMIITSQPKVNVSRRKETNINVHNYFYGDPVD
jgi:hypothetical protein